MDGSRTSLRWMLVVTGILGLLLVVTMLPVVVGFAIGKAGQAYGFMLNLPAYVSWNSLSSGGAGVLIVGALSAALMIAGGWLNRGAAVLAAAWFVYAKWVFTVDLYWQNYMANTGSLTPYYVFVTIDAAVLLAVSILALVKAARLRRPAAGAAADSAGFEA